MEIPINADDLKLLAAVRERGRGCGEAGVIQAAGLREELGLDDDAMWRAATYLHAHSLLGMQAPVNVLGDGEEVARFLRLVWMTGSGENLMREIENAPGVGKRLTVAAIEQGKEAVLGVARAALTAMIQQGLAAAGVRVPS